MEIFIILGQNRNCNEDQFEIQFAVDSGLLFTSIMKYNMFPDLFDIITHARYILKIKLEGIIERKNTKQEGIPNVKAGILKIEFSGF